MKYTRDDIIQMVEEEDVEFIRLQFTDLFGTIKNVAITASQLEKALDNKCKFDVSSIEGFVKIEGGDMYLHPQLDTFTIFPWRPQQGKVARLICDIYNADGTPFEGSSRYILEKAVKKAADMGYTLEAGPECEFFLFNTDDEGNPTTSSPERAGYFDVGPVDLGENARRDMVLCLEDMGFEIESSHHEVSPAQHEIDFKSDEAMKTADNIVTFKFAVKSIAKRHGLHASFMPKPKMGVDGSGMHLNMILKKDGKDVFADENDKYGLSKLGYNFIAGLLSHIKAISAISNPLVNSYKRLIPGYEAPIILGWTTENKSPIIRVVSGRDEDLAIELRNPDPAANPYLLLATCLYAGLEGIEKNLMPTEPILESVSEYSVVEAEKLGFDHLPTNLMHAIKELKQDELMKDVLGEHIYKNYIRAKEEEWRQFSAVVTNWEIEHYLYKI